MSLEGLRAWIGEVERKLGMRTRVFLALTVIAVGLGGAAIYLAIDARESSVSESDVQALQERLEAQTGGGDGVGTQVVQLESELRALQAEVAELQGESSGSGKQRGASEEAGGSSSGGGKAAVPDTGEGASSGESDGASTGGASNQAELQQLLEQPKEKSAEADTNQTGK